MPARPPERGPSSRTRPVLVAVADDGARVELPCSDPGDAARKKAGLVAAIPADRAAAMAWWYYPDPAAG